MKRINVILSWNIGMMMLAGCGQETIFAEKFSLRSPDGFSDRSPEGDGFGTGQESANDPLSSDDPALIVASSTDPGAMNPQNPAGGEGSKFPYETASLEPGLGHGSGKSADAISSDEGSGHHQNRHNDEEDYGNETPRLPGESEGESPTEPPTQGEVDQCTQHQGATPKMIHVTGGTRVIDFQRGEPLFVKVTGNTADVTINFKAGGEGEAKLCLFVTGNLAKVNVQAEAQLDSFIYKGRGNESSTVLTAGQEGDLGFASADLSGNMAHLSLKNVSSTVCNSVEVITHGNEPKFECQSK